MAPRCLEGGTNGLDSDMRAIAEPEHCICGDKRRDKVEVVQVDHFGIVRQNLIGVR